jgi:hypothetical protein
VSQPAEPLRHGGRPRAPVSDDPEVEARRERDRQRKRQALLDRKAKQKGGGQNDAAAAVEKGAARRSERATGKADPEPLPAGWLRQMMEADKTAEAGSGRSVSQLRYLALRVLEVDGLAVAQEILADPRSSKTDKLRALDIVIKLGAGYINPDQAGGEDVPDLPAPIFTTTEGQLPGEGIVTDENMSLSAEDDSEQDTGGPQLAAVGGSGPVPHVA